MGTSAFAKPSQLPETIFLNTTDCNSNPSAMPVCQMFSDQFADWDSDSVKQVDDAINEMPSEKIDRVLELTKTRGLRKIVFLKLNGKALAETTIRNDTAYIAFKTMFFETPLRYANVSEKTHTLLHELIHVYVGYFVGNDLFSAPFWEELIEILDWNYAKGFNPMVNVSERDMHLRIRNKYKAFGQLGPAIAEDLDYSRKIGFPSLYSMSRLEEYFCELTAYLIHDPTIQKVPPARVINWYLKTNLGFLFDSQTPVDETYQMPERRADAKGDFSFVGLLYDEGSPVCTVTVFRHGTMQMARECLKAEWFKDTSKQSRLSFLSVRFKPANGKEFEVDGSQFNLNGAFATGDLVNISYPAELTSGKIDLPIFDFMNESDSIPSKLFTVSHPKPEKIQHSVRMVSDCNAETKMCLSWFNSAGGFVFAPSQQPGHLQVWGVLPHTFSPNSGRAVSDSWGPYVYSNFVPLTQRDRLAKL